MGAALQTFYDKLIEFGRGMAMGAEKRRRGRTETH